MRKASPLAPVRFARRTGALLDGSANRIERIELWWEAQGVPDWHLAAKLPLRAVEIIRRDFARPLVIAKVARPCGQSLRQLQRRFRAAFGITPRELLLMARLPAAMRLLEATAHTAAEITRHRGFVDASSFAQQCKKRTGTTPARHRRDVVIPCEEWRASRWNREL